MTDKQSGVQNKHPFTPIFAAQFWPENFASDIGFCIATMEALNPPLTPQDFMGVVHPALQDIVDTYIRAGRLASATVDAYPYTVRHGLRIMLASPGLPVMDFTMKFARPK